MHAFHTIIIVIFAIIIPHPGTAKPVGFLWRSFFEFCGAHPFDSFNVHRHIFDLRLSVVLVNSAFFSFYGEWRQCLGRMEIVYMLTEWTRISPLRFIYDCHFARSRPAKFDLGSDVR